MELKMEPIEIPEECNVIFGQSHFIKTVEDLYEIMVGAVPGAKFGIGFCEASGHCLVRGEGNDEASSRMLSPSTCSMQSRCVRKCAMSSAQQPIRFKSFWPSPSREEGSWV